MTIDFIGELEDRGFAIMPMGGNCQALVLDRGASHIVLTGSDGAHLPSEGDWMACRYDHRLDDEVQDATRTETSDDGRDIGEAIANLIAD